MSSKATRSSLAIISVIHGVVRILLNEKRFTRVDIREELEVFNKLCAHARDTFPGSTTHDGPSREWCEKVKTIDFCGDCIHLFNEKLKTQANTAKSNGNVAATQGSLWK